MADPVPTTPVVPADLIAAVVAAVRAELVKPVPQLLPQEDAIAFLGISRSAFFRLKSAGKLPRPVAVEGAGLHYRRADLERWVSKLKTNLRRPSGSADVTAET